MTKNDTVTALGAMSGTSLDGIDAAVVVTDGIEIFDFGPTYFREYSTKERAILHSALGHWPDTVTDEVAELIETTHASALSGFDRIDVIGFHGQTLAHDPDGGRTHQCGDGQVLASVLNCPVVWDFRSADMKFGGQGAPLAPFYHFALAKYVGALAPIAFLNLGGVGNITYVDPRFAKPEQDGALLAFDTGPANAPINDLMMDRLGKPCDAAGALAKTGQVDDAIISDFLSSSYFFKMPPKSLDRNDFTDLLDASSSLSDADAAATLTAACVMAVSEALRHLPHPPKTIYVTGGGRKNTTMMDMLNAAVAPDVTAIEDIGLDGDMLEAQAFAYLAVRVMRGLPTSCASTTGVRAAVSGGTISRPS